MAGSIAASPGVAITPSSVKATLPTNYITNFNFLSQYLPDTYEQEFERYGNRSIASFLRMVGAELPSNSDMVMIFRFVTRSKSATAAVVWPIIRTNT